jgi:Rrf2 family protein
VRAKILSGIRGPRGGYSLARERRRITVGEIIRVVRSMEQASDPLQSENGSELAAKVIRPIWVEMQNELMERLDKLTVEELCTEAFKQNVVSEGRQNLDFTI